MWPPQDGQEVLMFFGFIKVMVALQCGQGIFCPRFSEENVMCPLHKAQDIFRDSNAPARLRCRAAGPGRLKC